MMKNTHKSRAKSLSKSLINSVKKQDALGSEFRMKLNGDDSSLRSCTGAICTIIIYSVILLYALNKLTVLYNKKDVDVLSMVDDHAIDPLEKFNNKDGFNIAVGLTAYDKN